MHIVNPSDNASLIASCWLPGGGAAPFDFGAPAAGFQFGAPGAGAAGQCLSEAFRFDKKPSDPAETEGMTRQNKL